MLPPSAPSDLSGAGDPAPAPVGSGTTSRLAVPVPSLIYPSSKGVTIHALREGSTTIGRAADNDLALSDKSVAEHHAVIVREGDRISLRDLLSGKTFVNEVAAKGGELKPGDVLRLGEIRVRVAYAAPALSGPTGTRRITPSSNPALPALGSAPAPARTPTGSYAPMSAETRRITATEDGAALRERDARRSKALSRLHQLSDEVAVEDDLEKLLKRIAQGFVEIFDADRGVCLLLEEDGRNPLLTVEKRKEGSEEGTGVAVEIIEKTLQARAVVRIAGPGGDRRSPGGGLAAPLISWSKALGLLFFERGERGAPFEADDVHMMAIITNQVTLAVARLLASG
ncbi:FHA domain-containing protein [bacterium]|nr:FHA domain-containing protein [bacterium]